MVGIQRDVDAYGAAVEVLHHKGGGGLWTKESIIPTIHRMGGASAFVDTTFASLRRSRRVAPVEALLEVGKLSAFCLGQLHKMPRRAIDWHGQELGRKAYVVYSSDGAESRGINTALFESDPSSFEALWSGFVDAIESSQSKGKLIGVTGEIANRCVYTALMAFAALLDVTRRNQGQPGAYLEMIIGPIISLLTGRREQGAVVVPITGTEFFETVTVDLSFPSSTENLEPVRHWLVIPTKMSTRERIVQPYVHHRILSEAGIGLVDTVLLVANECNKTSRGGITETLVPGTIALYERYIGKLTVLVYLDPPIRYLDGVPGLPKVMYFGDFITSDAADCSLRTVLR